MWYILYKLYWLSRSVGGRPLTKTKEYNMKHAMKKPKKAKKQAATAVAMKKAGKKPKKKKNMYGM